VSLPDHPYLFLVCLWPIALYLLWAIWNSICRDRNKHELLRTQYWPEGKGKVVSAQAAGWAHVEITYKYCVGDRSYTGKHKINLSPVMVDKTVRPARELDKEARQYIADYPPDANVALRYKSRTARGVGSYHRAIGRRMGGTLISVTVNQA
jgi:hypothetical protein